MTGPTDDVRPRRRSWLNRAIAICFAIALVSALIGFALPRIAGADMSEILTVLGGLSIGAIALLAFITVVNQLVYAMIIRTVLPELSIAKALVVNLAGSAVSNVTPFGGGAGAAVTLAILRSWGLTTDKTVSAITIAGIWSILLRLILPALALPLLLVSNIASAQLIIVSLIGTGIAIAIAAFIVFVMNAPAGLSAANTVGTLIERLSRARLHKSRIVAWIERVRETTRGLLAEKWLPLTLWTIALYATQFSILLTSLRVLGVAESAVSVPEALMSFALARLIASVPITPDGAGFVETGIASALIGFGGDGLDVAAAVLLYRGFTYLLEIPAGGLAALVWAGMTSWRQSPDPDAPNGGDATGGD